MNSTTKPPVTYRFGIITEGGWRSTMDAASDGHVRVEVNGKTVAQLRMDTVMERDRPTWDKLLSKPGNSWRRMGAVVLTLPQGVHTDDVVDAYLIARDEMLDLGYTVED